MFVQDFSGDNVFFESFRLSKGADRHGQCSFRIFVTEEMARDCMNRVGRQLYVAPEEDHAAPVFCGLISSVAMEKHIGSTIVEVKAVSPSILLDEKPQNRIFQNPDKTFGEILENIDMGSCSLQLDRDFKNSVYRPVVLQKDETDFSLLSRMAHAGGMRIWVNDQKQDAPVIKLAASYGQQSRNLAEDAIIKFCQCRMARGYALRIGSLEHFEPGSLLTLGDDSRVYLVLSYELTLDRGRDIFSYELEEFKKDRENSSIQKQQTEILKGTVTDNADPENLGRIRVNFEGMEDNCPGDKKLWLPFRPVWGAVHSGTVFVPDKNELLEVIFVNGDVHASATLREKPLLEECRQVTDKYIGNDKGQRIFWKEKSLVLMSAKNVLSLDEEKVEITVGDNRIRMDDKGIRLETPKARIQLDDKGLTFHSSGDANIGSDGQWQVKCGGKAHMQADGDFAIGGSSVAVKASSGSVNIGKKVNLGS